MNRILKVAAHIAVVFATFLLAFQLRTPRPLEWWLHAPMAPMVIRWAGLYSAIALIVEIIFADERTAWRFTSLREVLMILRSASVTVACFLLVIFLSTRAFSVPRAVVPLSWLLTTAGLISIRVVARASLNTTVVTSLFLPPRHDRQPLVLVGSLESASAFLRSATTDMPYEAVAILSRNRTDKGVLVHGVPVIGAVEAMGGAAVQALGAGGAPPSLLFLEDPTSELAIRAEDLGDLRSQGYRFLRRPKPLEFMGREDGQSGLKEIKLEELLGRSPIALDSEVIVALVRGRRVLVTGAGGSIGSEISRQLAALGCAHLSLIDHSEFQLFQIDRELRNAAAPPPSQNAILCNVREPQRVRDVFLAERPDIVFHAAALKHVSLVEQHACEAVLTNVAGTRNVISAASQCGAAQMVLVSTDKAVAPSCVMGATKRLAEALLPVAGRGATRYCAVRFGNVLGSTGSVVPIFREQIERGGPVTVTDPDVERFFMTIPEAVQLVLHAAALSRNAGGHQLRKFALEMGAPVKIMDLARQMIELDGKRPDRDIKIVFTGLKPGEKLSEVLLDENEFGSSCVSGVTEITTRRPERRPAEAQIARLIQLAEVGDTRAVLPMIEEAVSYIRGEEDRTLAAIVAGQ